MAAELEERIATITEDSGRLLAVLSGMVEGVVAVDREMRVLLLNASAGQILDVDAESSIGKPIWEVTRLRKVNETIEQAFRNSTEVTGEIFLQHQARNRIVELHAAPLGYGDPDPRGVVLVLHEVTELRRLETVRQDFVANVSHELKTPITAIRGLIETVLDAAAMPTETRSRFLKKAQDQSKRLSLLVTDLLTLSRLESADGGLQPEVLELRELVLGSLWNLQPTAEAKQVRLIEDIPHNSVLVSGDWDLLELVMNNLLDNALKYTPAGGSVTVRFQLEQGSIAVEIADTGIGIAQEHHDRIFERF
jgi:two-component system phosphate regulon sensor histidine kinase PhoR